MRGNIMKRLLCVIMVIAMLSAYAIPAYAAEDATVTFKQVDNDKVSAKLSDREPVELPEQEAPYADTDVVRVSIMLEKASTIEAGYSINNIAGNSAAMTYRSNLEKEQTSVVGKIEAAIQKDLDVVWNLTLAANIISANVAYGDIEAIEQVSGVKSVVLETRYEPDVVSTGAADPNMATSSAQIGSTAAWAAGYTGAGSKIAIIDTGVDKDHEAFNSAAFDYSLSQLDKDVDLMDAEDISAVLKNLNAYKRSRGLTAEKLYVNSKIAYGFNYVDVDTDIVHVNDGQGEHGSHVAGIATANAYVKNADGSFSKSLNTTFVQGVAPDAQLMVMKVFGKSGGAYDSDYMAAIEDAIVLGADSVNLSLGSGNPGMSRATNSSAELGAYQDILDSLEKSGVVVAISAGNSGAWMDSAETGAPYLYLDDVSFQTNGSPGSFTNAFTVASVDNDGFTATYVTVDGNMISYSESDYNNKPMTTLAGTREYVLVDGLGNAADFAAIGDVTGKIVMCYRGEISFSEKGNNAAAAGAAGVIVVNNQPGIINMDLTDYKYTVPCVSILQADGEFFKAAGEKHTTDSGLTYWTGSMDISASMGAGQYNSEYYTMSSFSSWGIPGSLELKPEITAPGGNIYSVAGANKYGNSILFGDHASYELMSGTSMAAPQVTGMAAVVAQYIRESGLDKKTGLDERTLAQSLLMSTAVPMRDANSEGNYYPVIQQGAGLANVGAVTTADSYILMGANATDSYSDGKVKVELGDDPAKTGVYTFSFTINNLTDVEKTFALSADVFTQDAFNGGNALYLDTWTRNLTPIVSWTVDGKAVDSGDVLAGMDFNGDGVVNSADGQALLDYATGLDVTLSNTDKADLNGDGEVNSYDSYEFFSLLSESGAVVPANGSAEVTVTISLSNSDKAWLANYENGAYIEAYVYAESLSTAEGVEGTTHSIPVLGFYGNWSDPSMFDKGSYMEYANGLENRAPYLYATNFQNGNYNGLLITYADEPNTMYWFGGNPMVEDATYMPERNAISAVNGDMIAKIGFASIRNAADSYFQVIDSETGDAYINQSAGEVLSAYYYVNGGTWRNTFWTLNTSFTPAGIPDDTALEVGVTLIPEYYVDDNGNVNWDALGDGVTFSMPMVVDNTAPVIEGEVEIDTENKLLNVTVSDNQYIAAVALFDSNGQTIFTFAGSDPQQNAGDSVDYVLDLSKVNGNGFLLQVYDYAYNITTYEIDAQIGETTETIEGVQLNKTSTILQLNGSETLVANVLPTNASNRNVFWTSSNDAVVSVDENGTITANAVGNATITATSEADETKSATCRVEVINISAQLNGIVWDEEGSIWFSEFQANKLPNYTKLSPDMLEEDYFVAATMSPDGTLYASSLDTSTGTGSLYTVDTETWEVTKLTDCVVQGIEIFYSDLTYAPAMFGTGALLGTYGPFVIAIDPVTGEPIGIIDEYDRDLVGIATCYGQYDEEYAEYQDVIYVIQNDGVVIQEIYYGYDGMVVPMMYYFYGFRAAMDSGVSVNDAWYFNSAYYDGTYLYWSAFDQEHEDNVTLYAIDADYSGNVYNMGKFADGVWPVGGLYQNTTVYSVDEAKLEEVRAMVAEKGMPEVAEFQLVAKEFAVDEAKVGGSLNSVSGETKDVARPMSDAVVGENENTVTVTITAKDIEGNAIASTNGVTTVTYDAEALELTNILVEGDYTAINKADGSVTFGYVAMEGIAADEVVATLIFEVKDSTDSITVTQKEVNDNNDDFDEVIAVDLPKVEVIASGWSGYTTWELTADGVLTFSPTEQKENGQTNLKNYWKVNGVLTLPWGEYADMITKVVIEDGIHDIGQMAFYELPNLESVVLGADVVEIRNYAFKNCASLTSVTGTEGLEFIREGAFYGCSALTELVIPEDCAVEDWAFSHSGIKLN